MPRTLAQNAQYIAETIKPAIKSAIEAQGVTVPSTDSFLDYADRIGEIEGGGSGYQLKDLPTGSISTVTDAAELPLNALKVSVEAVQSGSGTPSPSNIRPISGWDSGNITVSATGNFYNSANTIRFNQNSEVVINSIDSVTVRSVSSGTYRSSRQLLSNYNISVGKKYRIKADVNYISGKGMITIRNSNNTVVAWSEDIIQSGQYELVFDLTNEMDYISLFCTFDANENGDITYNNISFEEFNVNATVDFPTTIYGAEWDVVGGSLEVTDSYIASYNGETLPSTWISDRDEYASGTTPTIGAEVVYKLATPTTIDISPLSIRLLQGTNNLYADCGEVIEGEYFVDEGAHRYQLYDYIESDGTQYIDTGRKVNAGDTFDILYSVILAPSGQAWSTIWGAYDGNNTTRLVLVSSNQKDHYDGGTFIDRTSYATNNIYSDSFIVNNALNGDVYVFSGTNDITWGTASIRLYQFSINGDYYLPCKRKSDGVFGLWDATNQTFLTDSAGGNAFVGGNPTGVEV